MNKEEFLKELESRLKILDQRERQDMLSEYSQHIDMKIQSGMKEKEAIEDFGDIDSLAQEILEVYHIDPDYRTMEEERPMKKGKKSAAILEQSRESISGFLEQKKVRRKEKKEKKKDKQDKKFLWNKDKKVFSSAGLRRTNQKIGQWYKEVWKWMKWIVRMCLKAIWIVITIPVVVIDIIALFGLGALLILLVQGYPLIGVTFGVCGIVLCCSAYSLLVFSYIAERKREDSRKEVGA